MSKTSIFINGEKYELDSNHVKVGKLIELGGGNSEEYELQKRKDDRGPVEKILTNPEDIIEICDGETTNVLTGNNHVNHLIYECVN